MQTFIVTFANGKCYCMDTQVYDKDCYTKVEAEHFGIALEKIRHKFFDWDGMCIHMDYDCEHSFDFDAYERGYIKCEF